MTISLSIKEIIDLAKFADLPLEERQLPDDDKRLSAEITIATELPDGICDEDDDQYAGKWRFVAYDADYLGMGCRPLAIQADCEAVVAPSQADNADDALSSSDVPEGYRRIIDHNYVIQPMDCIRQKPNTRWQRVLDIDGSSYLGQRLGDAGGDNLEVATIIGASLMTRIRDGVAGLQRLAAFENDRSRPYERLDMSIAPLIGAMKRTGLIKTIASCEGHATGNRSPYVYFKAPTRLAGEFERVLRRLNENGDSQLTNLWVIQGCFNQHFELCFRLSAPEYDFCAKYQPVKTFIFGRRRVDAELKALVGVFEDAVKRYKSSDQDASSS